MTVSGLHPWPWKAALCLCAVSLLLLGNQLEFSGYAHADEPNKVHQITQGKYNFNHPLLMLHSVKLYARAIGISDDYDAVMRAGRWNSVVFSSLAIGFLVLLTGRLHGGWIGAAAGALVLFTPLFFELAHYFKEDPALIFGLSLSLLAMQFYGEKPSAVRAAMLGAACGVAVAGKYAGLIIVPFAVYVVLANRRARDLWVVAFSAVALFALVNFPMITSPDLWKSRVDYEVSRLKATGVPNPRKVPHGDYFSDFYKHASPFVLLLLAAYLWGAWRRKFRLSPAEWTLLLLPTIYLVILCFIPTKTERYILPASVVLACVAAAGLAPLQQLKHGKAAAALVFATAIAWQAPRVYAENAAFASRRHAEVLTHLQTQLPASATVLVDNYQSLEPSRKPSPAIKQRTLQPHETLQSLAAEGYTHILVTSKRYPVFASTSRRASGMPPEDNEKMRVLYDDIFGKCRLVFEWRQGKKKQLEPEFRLYELPQK